MSKTLLNAVFNHDFSQIAKSEDFHARFFAKTLSPAELHKICAHVCDSHVILGDKTIPSALLIPGKTHGAPFAILAQLHGNEPAGLAGILLAMALSDAGLLERNCIAVIGNPLAAKQYFAHRLAHPDARQETRDAYRCGLSEDGVLLPDMNRIPVDFRTRTATDHHTRRAQELFALGEHIRGIADIHSARGNMLCITDHKHDSELRHSPIRAILTGLAEAISANASAAVTVQTLKTILGPLPNIEHQVGIEAGRHEDPLAPFNAATFTLSLLHTLGIAKITPLFTGENGIFDGYAVQPRITYADLEHADTLLPEDQVYMVKFPCAAGDTPCPGAPQFALHQYDEMEPIAKGEIVAVAVPSATIFKTKSAFSGIFVSKSAALYDKDPSVGPWPVASDKIDSVKFCYPCNVTKLKIEF